MQTLASSLGILLGTALLWAQTAPRPEFDVASVKLDTTSKVESGTFEHGTLTIRYATLRHLIASAYNMRVDLVDGGPGWIDVDRFEIDAKTSPNTTEDEERVMLGALLADRFALQSRRADVLKDVFVLTPARQGAKPASSSDDSKARLGCWGMQPMVCHKITIANLADRLRRYNAVDRPVVDETGLEGFYDFNLFFDTTPLAADTPAEAPAKSIFQSLRDNGLKLEPAKRPVSSVVIEHVERKPLPN